MSSQRRDFRRMLYRLDLATSYPSIPALIQHFMDETALDGVVEVKLVASPPVPATRFTKGKRSTKPPPPPPPPLQPATSVISFRREGRDVNAIALFGPASRPPSIMMTEEQGGSHGFESTLAALGFPEMVVKKRYPPRTTLVWVFAPLVQKLLDAGADTVMFEVRSYIAGADSVRESQSALSPVSPYGVTHSASEASPSVLASGSTPSSGMGSGYDDAPTAQHARSPTAYPHVDNKAPILTELHRRPRELRAEATSYEPLRPSHYSPVQRHSSMPEPSPEATAPHWSYPQPGAWSTATGYSDLQPLPPAPTWEASLSSEGWNESSGPTWQSDPATVSYGYSTIPPLPWQAPQHSPYTPSALEPIADQTYFDTATSPSFHEGFYVPDSGLDDQPSFPSTVPGTVAPQSGEDPMGGYASPSIRFRGDNQNASWQMQYPYFGALDIPPGEAFSYSNAPQVQGATAVSEFNQHSSTGSPASPPDSSERDSLTPTLTNPGYDRSSAPAPVPVASPRKQWPFARGHENPFGYRSVSAYTPVAPSTGPSRPPAARSVSSMLPRSRVRLRSGSPEPTREASIRGAKRLKVNPSFPTSSHIHPVDVASPPPLSASSSNSAHRSIKSRVSSTVRSASGARASHKTISPVDQMPGQEQTELDTSLLEILTRPAPYKRMLGYAARQHDGSITAYELSDSVAVTTSSDTLLGLGLSSVTNVAALGMELGRRAAHKQQQQQESSLRTAVASNTYGEHAAVQEPRGSDRTGYLRGVTSKPKWQGCVIAGYV